MENPCASSQLPATSYKQSNRWLAACGLQLAAAASGFALTLQTVWILRPGTLGGVPWPLATIGVYASDVVLFIAAVVGVVRMWRGGDHPSTPPIREFEISNLKSVVMGWGTYRNVLTALALLIIVAIVNIRIGADPWLSAVGWLRIFAFLLALVGIPSWSASTRRAFLGGFLVAMLGHVIIGLMQFFTLEAQSSTLLGIAAHNAWTLGDSVITAPGERWLRAYGGFPHPNVFGTALLVALVALAYRPIRSFIIHHSSFIIFTFALVLSFSRAAWLGFVLLLIVMVVRRSAPEKDDRPKLEQSDNGGRQAEWFPTRSLVVVGAAAFVVFLLVLWPLVVPRFTGSTTNEQRSLSERTNSIRDAVYVLPGALKSSGHGLHALPAWMYERYGSPNPEFFQRHPEFFQPVHNVPFLILIELGGIGTFVLMLVLVLIFRHSSLITRHSSLLLLALAPSMLFDHHLWSLPIGLALLFALAVATTRLEEQHPA